MVESLLSSSVRKNPGSTSIVRMPKGAISGVSDSIHPSIPNFAAAYAVQNIWPAMPAVEEMVTRRPERCLRITGKTARVTFIGPNSKVSSWSRNCSGLSSSKKPAKKFPALLTRTSIASNFARAASTAA